MKLIPNIGAGYSTESSTPYISTVTQNWTIDSGNEAISPGPSVSNVVTVFLVIFTGVCVALLLLICLVLYLFHLCQRISGGGKKRGRYSLPRARDNSGGRVLVAKQQIDESPGGSGHWRARPHARVAESKRNSGTLYPPWIKTRRNFDANGIRNTQPIVFSNPVSHLECDNLEEKTTVDSVELLSADVKPEAEIEATGTATLVGPDMTSSASIIGRIQAMSPAGVADEFINDLKQRQKESCNHLGNSCVALN